MEKNGFLKKRNILVFVAAVLLLFAGMGHLYWNSLLSPVGPVDHPMDIAVNIPRNSSAGTIGIILYRQKLVRGPELVSLYSRIKGSGKNLKPGSYTFNTAMSLPAIMEGLVRGPDEVVKIFTVPEGFNLAQITEMLSEKGLVDRDKFMQALGDRIRYQFDFVADIPPEVSLEGYLFPDTYHINDRTGEEDIVRMMLQRLEKELENLDYREACRKEGHTLHQAITIASLVEGEARVDSERAVISSVVYNRLAIGMPLQIDATVLYALGEQKDMVLYKDLEVDSPYNTYRVNGLPPGPINSPGSASLQAAVNPDRTRYLYYVAKPDGSHAFATTLAEHNNNKRKYQK